MTKASSCSIGKLGKTQLRKSDVSLRLLPTHTSSSSHSSFSAPGHAVRPPPSHWPRFTLKSILSYFNSLNYRKTGLLFLLGWFSFRIVNEIGYLLAWWVIEQMESACQEWRKDWEKRTISLLLQVSCFDCLTSCQVTLLWILCLRGQLLKLRLRNFYSKFPSSQYLISIQKVDASLLSTTLLKMKAKNQKKKNQKTTRPKY